MSYKTGTKKTWAAIFNPRRIKSIVLPPWPLLKTLQSEVKGGKTIGFFKDGRRVIKAHGSGRFDFHRV
jgi:hypothetical protein